MAGCVSPRQESVLPREADRHTCHAVGTGRCSVGPWQPWQQVTLLSCCHSLSKMVGKEPCRGKTLQSSRGLLKDTHALSLSISPTRAWYLNSCSSAPFSTDPKKYQGCQSAWEHCKERNGRSGKGGEAERAREGLCWDFVGDQLPSMLWISLPEIYFKHSTCL